MLKLGHIELFVADPLASKDFYVDVLGFELVTIQDNQYVWVKSGQIEILLRSGRSTIPTESYQTSDTGLVLYTDDVKSTADKLGKHGLIFKGMDGAEDCLTFTDPDGHWFQLVNPDHD